MRQRQHFPRREGTPVVGYWDGAECEYCRSPITEQRVEAIHKIGGVYVLIENVPTGVCTKCHARYYAADVVETLEQIQDGPPNTDRELRVSVYTYA